MIWFLVVPQKPAFASPSCGNGELGSFYRECQTAPSLELFNDLPLTSIENVVVGSKIGEYLKIPAYKS